MNINRLLIAIEDSGTCVTAEELSAETGLPLAEVRQKLQLIAWKTKSHIVVSDKGQIAYKFDKQIANIFESEDRAAKTRNLLASIGDSIFFAARITFCICLIYLIYLFHPPFYFEPKFALPKMEALILYFSSIAFIIWGERDKDPLWVADKKKSAWVSFGQTLGFSNLMNIFSWHYRWRHHRLENILNLLEEEAQQPERKASLFSAYFSFVFGDGDPNYRFYDLQWQVIAEIIRENKGAITIEQIAPYLGNDSLDENSMLPVLVRFNGYPEVSATGNIIYIFPEMPQSQRKKTNLTMPPFLIEDQRRFSELPFPSIAPVWFASTILFLIAYIECHYSGSIITWAQILFPEARTSWHFLLPFSTFCLAAPAFRWFTYNSLNYEITQRNQLRQAYGHNLLHPNAKLKQKLLEAKAYEQEPIGSSTIEYTTEKSLLDQNKLWRRN